MRPGTRSLKGRLSSAVAIVFCLLSPAFLAADPAPSDPPYPEQLLRSAVEALARLEPYADILTPDLVGESMIRGLVAGLSDPYAAVSRSTPASVTPASAVMDRGFSEYGFLMGSDEYGRLVVADVSEVRSDLLTIGDRVLRIGEVNVAAMDPWDAFSVLLEDAAPVPVAIEDARGVVRTVAINPLTVAPESVTVRIGRMRLGRWRDDPSGDAAWITINSFVDGLTHAQWEEAVQTVWGSPSARSIILDVRGNGGGDNSCLSLLGDFFPHGTQLVQFRALLGEQSWTQSVANTFRPRSRFLSYPTAVLVDRHTASLAEVFAAALSEQRTAPLVGETTYGKGTTQSWLTIGEFALHVTTGAWMTPSGRSIDGQGLSPDVVVSADHRRSSDRMLSAALRELDRRRR